MPRVPVDSLDDPRIAAYRSLKTTNLTRWSNVFISEGRRVVERLLASDFEVQSLLVSQQRESSIAPMVPSAIPMYVLPLPLAQQLVGYNFHCGILACARRKPASPLSSVADNGGKPLTLVVCPDVNDPENLGSIIRLASAFGIQGMVLGAACADPFSRRVSRLSMGHVYRLPIVESDDITRDLEDLRNRWQVELAATVLDESAEHLGAASRPDRFALVLGNEAQGLKPDLLKLCDRKITIPMQSGDDSLNVAVAAGIFLYHFTR